MEVEWSQSEKVTQPAPGAQMNILGMVGATDTFKHFCLQIQNLLQK